LNVLILRRSPPLHGLLIVWNVSMWNWSKPNAVLYKIMKLQKISSLSDLFSELVWNQSPSSLPQPSTSLLFVPCVCLYCCNCDGNMSALFPHPTSL
jgi:hypothetical protein